MENFRRFFTDYLGANRSLLQAGQRIFPSISRVEPETSMSYMYHHLIAAVYDNMLIHSIAPSLLPEYREIAPADITDDVQQRVDDAFAMVYNGKFYQTRKMFRYTTEDHFEPSPAVTVLSEGHRDIVLNRMGHRGTVIRERFWKGTMAQMVREGRVLAVLEGNAEVARSNITDLPCGACNIDIWTHSGHRRKGYAKALVRRAVNWCHDHGKVPVYLVHASNEPSIKLAESIGLTRMTTEIQTVVIRY